MGNRLGGIVATLRHQIGQGRMVGMLAQVLSLRMVAFAINLATGLISAAALGPQGRGELAALILAPQFLLPVALLGLQKSLIFNAKTDLAQEGAFLGWALVLGSAAGLLVVAVAWPLLPLWLVRLDAEAVTEAQRLLFILPFSIISTLVVAALEIRGRFFLVSGNVCLPGAVTLAALLGLWTMDAITPERAALAYLLPIIPALLHVTWYLVREVRPRLAHAGAAVPRRLMHYGLRFWGADVLRSMASFLDQLVIVVLLEPAAVGIYAVALSVSRILLVLEVTATAVLFPNVASLAAGDVLATAGLAARIAGGVTAGAALVLGVIGPYLLQLLYGDAFTDAAAPLRLLLAETVIACVAGVLQQALAATGRPGAVSFIEMASVAVGVTLLLLLLPKHGTVGAASAVLGASIMRLICVLIGVRLLLKERMPRLLPNLADLRLALQR